MPGGLDDRAVRGDVAAQHGQPAVDACRRARRRGCSRPPRRCPATTSGSTSRTPRWCAPRPARRGTARRPPRKAPERGCPTSSSHSASEGECTVWTSVVQQPGPAQLAEDRRDAAGPVHVLHVVVGVRRHLGQARHPPGDGVDGGQVEVDLALLGGGQDVQHRVGGAAHGDVERHRVLERLARVAIERGSADASSSRYQRVASSIDGRARPARTAPGGRRAWRAWTRCRAARGRAPR